jgi:thioesterase domain-containing protein/acyl carrier protein
MAMPEVLGLSDADTRLSVSSYTFDGSVFDIFVTLALGATLVLATDAQTNDPRELGKLIESCEPTVMFATPTMWSMLIRTGWTGRPGLLAACGGEPLPDWLARELRQRCRAVWNGWGPTEATMCASSGFVEAGEPVTVGRPLPGVRIYVMDNRGRLVPCGVPGEIVVAGHGISRGYVNRPEETAQRYRLDPFVEGDRMYRTGDRGRLLADGRLQYLGRYDNQVKIRGFRIELGEVESVLVEHPSVREVAAAVRRNGAGQQQLVAYVVTAADGMDNARLRRWARGRLPAYMVPHVIVQLPALPTSPSGKLDRAALPAPPVPRAPSRPIRAETEPKTTTQRRLAGLWSELLPGTVEDPHRDFFELGGDSVHATRLLVEVERRFGISIAVSDFLEHNTLASLGALVDHIQVWGTRITRQRIGQPGLFVVYPDLISAMSLRHLGKLLERDNHVQALVIPLLLGQIGRSLSVEEMAEPLLRAVRTAQSEGPYRLIGYSFGGLLAYELGRLLHAGGEQVTWLGLLDTPAPAAARQVMGKWKSPSARMARLRRGGWPKVLTYGHNLRWSAREKLIAAGLVGRRPGEQFDVRHARQILRDCSIDGHDLPMNLFVTTDTVTETGSDSLGWAHVHKGPLEIHTAPGDHGSLLSATFAGEFTALISASLSNGSAEESTGQQPGSSTARA